MIGLKRTLCLALALAFAATATFAQNQRLNVKEIVEIEMLTPLELAEKIKGGMTSVLVAVGGTEVRGPHAVIAGHTILARNRAIGAAKKLGHALVGPVLPIAVAATGSRPATAQTPVALAPGAVQMPADAFKAVMIGQVESMAWHGFKDIFLMGDHGGGQQQMREAAEEMDRKLSAQGIRVYYIADFYQKTHEDIDMYMYAHKLPVGGHGAMMETAEMMYWEPFPEAYIRSNFKTAPVPENVPTTPEAIAKAAEQWKATRDARLARGRGGAAAPNAEAYNAISSPRMDLYGLGGNPRPATKAIGKDLADIGINNAVAEIRKQLGEKRGASR